MNAATTTANIGLRGFDFGTSFDVGVPIVPQFAEHLHRAGIEGCAYGHYPVANLGATLPSICLIGKDAAALRAAFAEFRMWAQGSDDDAVQVHFVFLEAGGYLIGITPDQNRWQARTTAGDPLLDPLLLILMWVKPIDTIHPMLLRIRDYYTNGFTAPIAFTAAASPTPGVASLAGLLPLKDLEPLVKFKWNFVNERDGNDPASQMILRIHKKGLRRKNKAGRIGEQVTLPPRTNAQWSKKRRRVLDQVFPVTTARFNRSTLIDVVREKLARIKIRPWQLDQSIANLVLSKKVTTVGPHYAGVAKEDLENVILNAARSHVEISNSTDNLSGFDADCVIKQLGLDIQYLLKENGISAGRLDLEKLQRKLIREGFADEA